MKTVSNQSKKTFTIRVNGNKFRTIKLSKLEFMELESNTENDWKNFLKIENGSYYIIK